MLVDIANEQARKCDVALVLGNSVYDKNILSEVSDKVVMQFLGRSPASRNPWYGLKLNLLLKKIKPDIIHAHNESFIRLIRFLSTPKVLTVHDTNIAHKVSIKGYDKVFCISEAVRSDLLKRAQPCSPAVVYNGVRFSAIRQKIKYGQRPFRIVQIGRLYHYKKGQDIILRAIAQIKRVGKGDDITVDFIGGGTGEEIRKSQEFLGHLAMELGIKSLCSFIGERPRSEIYQTLANYDLLVQPSRYEGFGLTVVEAMAARVPVLVSDIEGPMEIIDKGRYGYCFKNESFQHCAEKIMEIMSISETPGFKQKIDSNFAYAKHKFDINKTAIRYIEEYSNLI